MTGLPEASAPAARGGEAADGGPGGGARSHFRRRGWVLALLFVALAAARALSDMPLRWEGLALLALGMGWRLWAGSHIAGHSNGLSLGGARLALTGPYALGRHPLYLGNLLSAAGLLHFANCLPPVGWAALFLLAVLHHAALAAAEERHLLAVHGEDYRQYREATPRWFGLSRVGLLAAFTPGAGWAAAWRRQGLNLSKSAGAAMLLAALSRT